MDEKEKLELIEQNAQKEQAIANLTEELKELRKKKQEAEERANKQPDQIPTSDLDVGKKIEEALEARKAVEIETAKTDALEEFKSKFKEFSDDNDPGGIKFTAFQKELSKFSLDGLTTKEKILNRYKDAYDFMNRKKAEDDEPITPDPSIPNTPNEPNANDTVELSPNEDAVLKRMGWTKEKYLKLKAKQPEYVSSIFRQLS